MLRPRFVSLAAGLYSQAGSALLGEPRGLQLGLWSAAPAAGVRPEAPTQGGPTVSGTLGTGSQEEARLESSSGSVSASGSWTFELCPFVL